MIILLLKRLVALIVTLFAASVVVFTVMAVLPGDPAAIILGTGAREETLIALRRELGLDRPLVEQYVTWISGFVTGDLGRSYTYGVPVPANDLTEVRWTE